MTKEEFKARVIMLHESGYTGNWEEFLENMWKLHLEANNHNKLQEELDSIRQRILFIKI